MAARDRRRYSPRTRSPPLPPPTSIIPSGAVRLGPDRFRPAISSRRIEEQSEKSNNRGDESGICLQKLSDFNESLRGESASTKFRWEHLIADKSGRAAAVPVHPDKENERLSASKSSIEYGLGNENRFSDRKFPLGFYPLPSDNESGLRKNGDDLGRSFVPDLSLRREDRSIGNFGNYGGSFSLKTPAFIGDLRSEQGFSVSTGRFKNGEVANSRVFDGVSTLKPSRMPEVANFRRGCYGPNPIEESTKMPCGNMIKSRGLNDGVVDSNVGSFAVNGSPPRDDLGENRAVSHRSFLPPSLCNLVGGSRLKEQEEEYHGSSTAHHRNQHKDFFNNERLPSRKGDIKEMGYGDVANSGGIGGVAYSNAEIVAVTGNSPRDEIRDNRALNHHRCSLSPSFCNSGGRLKEQAVEFRNFYTAYLRNQQETLFNKERPPSTKCGGIDGIVYLNAATFGVSGSSSRDGSGENRALNLQYHHGSLPPSYQDLVGQSGLKEQDEKFWDCNAAYLRNQQEAMFNNKRLPSIKEEINEMGYGDITKNGGIDGMVYSTAATFGVSGSSQRDDLGENRALNLQHHHCSVPPTYHDLAEQSCVKGRYEEFLDSNAAYFRDQQEAFFKNEGKPSRKDEINEMGYGDITKSGGIDSIVYSNAASFGVNSISSRYDLGENRALNLQHHHCSLPPSYQYLIGQSRVKEQDEEFWDSNTAHLRDQQEKFCNNEGLAYREDEDSLDFGMAHLQNPSLVFGEEQLPRQEMGEVLDSDFNHLQNKDGMVLNRQMQEFGEECDLESYRLSQQGNNSYVSEGSPRQMGAAEDQRIGKQSWEKRVIDLRKVTESERPRKRSKAEQNSKSPDDIDIMRSDDIRQFLLRLRQQQDAGALQFDDLVSQRSTSQRSVFAPGRLSGPINPSSRKSVKERLGLSRNGANPKPLPWLDQDSEKKLQKKSSNVFGDRIQAHTGDLPKVEVKCANGKSHEDSEEFKQQVHCAFLKFVKALCENSANRRKYTEGGGTGIIKCCVCSSPKEFLDTRGLVAHAFSSSGAGLRAVHLGLHKALCLVMGWDSTATINSSWFLKKLRCADILSVKEELIIWPPVVLIHNSSITNNNSDDRIVVSNEELGAIIQGKGFSEGISKVCRGKPANKSIMVVMFHGTFSGLQEAQRLHQLYAENKHGRAELKQINPRSEKTQKPHSEKVESILYGYLGIADDLDKLYFKTKRRCVVKSKKKIHAIADACNSY